MNDQKAIRSLSDSFSRVANTTPAQRGTLAQRIAESGISNARIAWLASVPPARVCDYIAGRKKKCGKANVKKIRGTMIYLGLEKDPREARRRRWAKNYRAFHGAKIPAVRMSLNSLKMAVAMLLLQREHRLKQKYLEGVA